MLDLRKARYVNGDAGYPFLELTIGETIAYVTTDHKRELLEAGVVVLPELAQVVPPLTLPADPRAGRAELEIAGAVRDERVLKLAEQFFADTDAGEFVEGELAIG